MIYLAEELKEKPTISQGQCCDLKIEHLEDGLRVWLCRVGGGVTIERYVDGKWEAVDGGCMDYHHKGGE